LFFWLKKKAINIMSDNWSI